MNDLCDELPRTLESAGFLLSMRCPTSLACFDFATRRGDETAVVKIACKSSSVGADRACELGWIGSSLSVTPLIVCLNGPGKPMRDDTVYFRCGIPTITPQTLKSAVEQGNHPIVEARPGGFYVHLDGEAIEKRRSEMRLSLGELASMIGVSRRTIYGYERGLAKASVSVALKLEATFGVPVVRQVNLFKRRPQESGRVVRGRGWKTPMIDVAEKLEQLGYRVASVSMAPFDFVASRSPKERIIGGIVLKEGSETRRELTSSIAHVFGCHSLFVAEKPSHDSPGTISKEEFLRIREPEQLKEALV